MEPQAKEQVMTTDQGIPVSDNLNTLTSGARGPQLMQDFVLREKITQFDHERMPERVVHAKGSGAHGVFTPVKCCSHLTKAAFLQDPAKSTEVFVRFSTVAGAKGTVDLPRDVRGFATKFYTEEGNFDLVGNNMPVFFIQDAIQFPDLVHAVKPEPDRHYPESASAHDTFWDFVGLTPESMHMLVWLMSDRALPRSYRMMEGFGVHTFVMENAKGGKSLAKFHWRPRCGTASVLWEEAVKINGVDQEFHRRDLWQAIDRGDFPVYDLFVQSFDTKFAEKLPYDVLDATKLITEELLPLEHIGTMTLNRNPDNFFAETEQVAFCVANLPPGIDASNDPLMQGRLFSYLDTQINRFKTPNFTHLPINKPRCPMHNFFRDGQMQTRVPKGRVSYFPNSLTEHGIVPSPQRGHTAIQVDSGANERGEKVRFRPESFDDHYSQARMFYRSLDPHEQLHIQKAFTFELGKVETIHVRTRMMGHLNIIDQSLGDAVAKGLGMEGQATSVTPAKTPIDLDTSPALSILKRQKRTLSGRTVGVFVTDGISQAAFDKLKAAIEAAEARVEVVAPKIGGIKFDTGAKLPAHEALSAGASVLYDAVVILCSADGAAKLAGCCKSLSWVHEAFEHYKIIGHSPHAALLLQKLGITSDEGIVDLKDDGAGINQFIEAAKHLRIWKRESLDAEH